MTQRIKAMRPLDWALPPVPVRREMISRLPDEPTGKPPLLFVHGLGQGAWVFDEHWLPYAAERGFPAHAVSLRGHGGSAGRERLRRTLLRDYVHDVMQAIVSLPTRPVLVGHSLGAVVVQQVLARYPARAGVLVAPVGIGHGFDTAAKLLADRPGDFLHGVLGGSLPLRPGQLFRELDAAAARRYAARTGRESPLVQYQLMLPRRPEPPRGGAPVLVVGSPHDRLISVRTLRRTARFYGTEPVLFPGFGHALMLEPRWREPLDAILDWVERQVAV
ncbi:alpha/beta hydrolase [Carbonactinospora thermoautotrophica]|nr:alpha/beta hydrolase [Carbonactinospora thermoautotrophica]